MLDNKECILGAQEVWKTVVQWRDGRGPLYNTTGLQIRVPLILGNGRAWPAYYPIYPILSSELAVHL